MVAHLEVAASGSIVFDSRIAGKVCREIGIGLGASSSRLVKSQAARSDPREFTSSPVSRNGERARFPLEAEQEFDSRSEEHTSELQSPCNLVCRLLLEKKQ